MTINWSRCVYVDGPIDEALLTKLTPQIMALRQESKDAITVAINSGGGSLSVLAALRGLLTGCDQDGNTREIVTVVTHRAYSAAAVLLSFGDYAVALPHADLLFHDVRYGGLDDVTPSRALVAAKQLQTTNESASLKLAERMFGRWMWNYLDLNQKFSTDQKRFPQTTIEFKSAIAACSLPVSEVFRFDLAGFATSIFARLNRNNECLIENAMEHLKRWGTMMALSQAIPKYSPAPGKVAGTLDGALLLYQQLAPDTSTIPFGQQSSEEDLNLLLTLVLGRLALKPKALAKSNFEHALSDFALLKSIEDPKHVKTATKLMLRHKHVFFNSETADAWGNLDDEAKKAVMSAATPNVKAAWLLCVLVARELFNGEHSLMPEEAMCLGLVDEVPGSDMIQSLRQFRTDVMIAEELAKATTNQPQEA